MYVWSLIPSKYVIEAVNNCVKYLKVNFDGNYSLSNQTPNPLYEYYTDIDISDPLGPEQSSYFQSLIVVMRRIIEPGHIDISTEVLMILSFLA